MTLGSQLDLRHISLGVMAGNRESSVDIAIGTAFSIGGGFFVTAGHVARELQTYGHQYLGFLTHAAGLGAAPYMLGTVSSVEYHDAYDLAILGSSGGAHITLQWVLDDVALLTDIVVAGYPYALDTVAREVTPRAYRGSIAAAHKFRELSASPAGYELSIPAPRGLSGAPVLLQHMPPIVLGFVIQNGKTGMLVHLDTERDNSGAQQTIVERYEFLTFGRAVSSSAVADLRSAVLRGTLREHLLRFGLVVTMAPNAAV